MKEVDVFLTEESREPSEGPGSVGNVAIVIATAVVIATPENSYMKWGAVAISSHAAIRPESEGGPGGGSWETRYQHLRLTVQRVVNSHQVWYSPPLVVEYQCRRLQ
jgi:hypothetical protein